MPDQDARELAARLSEWAAALDEADEQAFNRAAVGVTLSFEEVSAMIRLLREARDVLTAPIVATTYGASNRA